MSPIMKPKLKQFAHIVYLLATLATALAAMSSAYGEQAEEKRASHDRQEPAKRTHGSSSELKPRDATVTQSSSQGQTLGKSTGVLSSEELRRLKQDISDAGRDIYTHDQAERRDSFVANGAGGGEH
jgi:hypothetical protein